MVGLTTYLVIWKITIAIASIELCKIGGQSKVCKNVDKLEDYVLESPPTPFPARVKIDIDRIDVLDVDEDGQTLQVQLKIRLYWIDRRLSVNRTKEEIEKNLKWFMISNDDLGDIWTPSVYIRNAVNVKSLKSIGDSNDNLRSIWFRTDENGVWYLEEQIVTFLCPMFFETFPYDSQACEMTFISWGAASYRLQLEKPTLHLMDKKDASQQNLEKYLFDFEAMQPGDILESGQNNSFVNVRVRFDRTEKDRDKIFSSYHAATGSFAVLSMVSYLIQVGQVPGRMGLLITICLILINAYSAVDAPRNRGYSTVELWLVGTMTPVFFGLVEYGVVLALQKFINFEKFSTKPLLEWIDFVSLIITILYFVAFNIYFWL